MIGLFSVHLQSNSILSTRHIGSYISELAPRR